MMSDLATFYESIDLDAIQRFVDQQRQEGLNLEFKVLGNDETFERTDRKNLAIAISGFANAEGGIVVWGVHAAKDVDGVDGATELRPIDNVARALSDLQSYTAQATSPITDGVDSKPIHDGIKKSGYLVSYVPATDGDPRMAKFGEDRNMKRSGDSFLKMEHFEIADMFGRRARPALSLNVDFRRTGTGSGPGGVCYDGNVVLGILNTGRGIARFPSIELDVAAPYQLSRYGLDGNGRTGLPKLVSRSSAARIPIFAGGADYVVHVNSLLDITTIDVSIRAPFKPPSDLKIAFRIKAEGIQPVVDEHIVPGNEIAARLLPEEGDAIRAR